VLRTSYDVFLSLTSWRNSMLSLHTNMASLMIQNAVANNQSALSASMTRLGTGYRINSASDDAAGLQIATRLKAQTSGMAVASQNTQNASSLMQTADGAFNEVGNILLRMKDLATQAADSSSSAKDKDAMQSEFDSLGNELSNIMTNTSYGGEKLFGKNADASGNPQPLDGKFAKAMTFQIGASSSETMTVDFSKLLDKVDAAFSGTTSAYNQKTDASGNPVAGTELTSDASANATIQALSDVIDSVGTLRSGIGASQNRLSHIASNLSNMSSNAQDATGRIMDVDYASETAKSSSEQILMQAGTSMLKQSSQMNQMILSLLQ
jgi:flagellin